METLKEALALLAIFACFAALLFAGYAFNL